MAKQYRIYRERKAKYPGTCARCGKGFPEGHMIKWAPGKTYHKSTDPECSGWSKQAKARRADKPTRKAQRYTRAEQAQTEQIALRVAQILKERNVEHSFEEPKVVSGSRVPMVIDTTII